ncbi:hypothetical protein BN2537_10337 [Streptomyces venezuelae]|nr:hypothetical protein BN2537_10337 [Streptomyces venezuelae]
MAGLPGAGEVHGPVVVHAPQARPGLLTPPVSGYRAIGGPLR